MKTKMRMFKKTFDFFIKNYYKQRKLIVLYVKRDRK